MALSDSALGWRALLVPKVVVEPVPGGQLAPLVDEHRGGRRAVLRQLPVGRVRAHLRSRDGLVRDDLLVVCNSHVPA